MHALMLKVRMNMDDSVTRTDSDIVLEVLGQLSALNIDAIAPLLAGDVVMEMPFAPGGEGISASGKDAVIAMLGGAPALFDVFRVAPHETWECPDRSAVIVEATSVGKYKAGGFYENRYGFVFVLRDGKITVWREYANPNAMAA